jgi:sugar lactone lactonase YvrE
MIRITAISGVALTIASLVSPAAGGAELLVADQAGNRIIALDEATGQFLRVVTETGLDLPSSLTFGPGGYLYATNFGAYAGPGSKASVVRIDVTTGVTTDFITDVAGPGAVAYDPVNSPDSLFVSKLANFTQTGADFTGNEVYQYDAASEGSPTLTRTIGSGSPATGRSGIAFDAAGNLYVTEFGFFGVGSILKYDAQNDFAPLGAYANGAGAVIEGPPGAFIPSTAGGLNGLVFSGDDLFAAALTGTAVIKFTPDGDEIFAVQATGKPIAYPSGLALAGDGSILVTSLGNNNASDPFYPGQLFPGTVLRYHPETDAVTPLLSGDANRDNIVDGDDLAVMMAAFGVDAGGDFDGDRDTDGDDFLIWQRSFGNQSAGAASFLPTGVVRYEPPAAVAAVPEPATIALAALGTIAVLGGTRRR